MKSFKKVLPTFGNFKKLLKKDMKLYFKNFLKKCNYLEVFLSDEASPICHVYLHSGILSAVRLTKPCNFSLEIFPCVLFTSEFLDLP